MTEQLLAESASFQKLLKLLDCFEVHIDLCFNRYVKRHEGVWYIFSPLPSGPPKCVLKTTNFDEMFEYAIALANDNYSALREE